MYVVPAIAIGSVIANAAIAWAATRRLESVAEGHESRIRALEVSVAVLQSRPEGHSHD